MAWDTGKVTETSPTRSMYGLWKQAGGGTPEYRVERYHELLRECGALLHPGDEGYDQAPKNLPCGWPGEAGA